MTSSYSAEQIQVLEGLEHVRKRPGMYIGSTGTRGLHHLVYEVVDNSIDEALAGYCTHVEVDLNPDGSCRVQDDGRGIPVDTHAKTGKSALETVLTVLGAGGKFGGGGYKVSGGLHGVGVSVVNALSEWLEVTVYRDKKVYTQRYERGIPQSDVKVQPSKETRTGTAVQFRPDEQIFSTGTEFDYITLAGRLRELAYLNGGVKITFTDNRLELLKSDTPHVEVYEYKGGIREYVSYMNVDKQPLHEEIIYVQGERSNVQVEVALQWCVDAYSDNVLGFANNIRTVDGGTHLEGLKTVLTRTMNAIARKRNKIKENEPNLSGEHVREGLTAVISVKVPEPEFEGQTKTKLGNTEVRGIVDSLVGEVLTEYLEFHPSVADTILDKAIQAFKAAEAARHARELVRRKSVLESSPLPGKLADCASRDPGESEIFLVEGDSAGGCLFLYTNISLTDGRELTLKEIIEEQEQGKQNFCYTVRESGNIGIEPIINARMTKVNAEVVKVTLDNGETIICTPDHPFMLRNGNYKPAAELTRQDSLMPLYRKVSVKNERGTGLDGYEMVWNPLRDNWFYTHLLADFYNLEHGVYLSKDGNHRHHVDFNKRNNNPTNIQRLPAEVHLELHRKNLEKTLHRPDVKEKSRQVHMSEEFRAFMSERMRAEGTRQILSEQAKAQWEDEAYKAYMTQKWREFYENNEAYRQENNEQLNRAQQEYWSYEANRSAQSERVRNYFANNPEAREQLSAMAKQQWEDEELLAWRREKTKEQWDWKFRQKRRDALDRTYYFKTIAALKEVLVQTGWIDEDVYESYRRRLKDNSLLRWKTFCDRYFQGHPYLARKAVENYNHRIISVERLEERMDVYDIEVPNSHNFALSAGVFVHNSAKQGRDRRFQAILPLRGKILNIEKTDDAKIYKNNEVQSLITALGLGVKGEEFDASQLRYHRVVIMSVAGDEPTLVMNNAGATEFVRIGRFIDDCVEGRRAVDEYQVMSFDQATHVTRFRPLKAVIRHGHEESMYKLTTRYNRSVKVTSSHSVFVWENEQVVLKKGNEVKVGDILVATRRIPRPATSPTQIDLLETFYRAELTRGLYVQGEDVRRVAARRVLARVERTDLWSEPRVMLDVEEWRRLIEARQAAGVSQKKVALACGVKQPITISHWERGINRPILSQFLTYLDAVGCRDEIVYEQLPSKIEQLVAQNDNSKNAKWREVSNYKPLEEFTASELAQLGPDVEIVPQAHGEKAFKRYLPITSELMYFLGWYAAEGTLSKHQVSLNLGKKDEQLILEIKAAIESVFGETPRLYEDKYSEGIKLYFHSVAAARLLQAWGLAKVSHQKKLPDIVFSVPEAMQLAFVEGYFLGDGTTAGKSLSFTTNSNELKEGLLYLLGQLGIIATSSYYKIAAQATSAAIQTRHPYHTICICGKEQIAALRPIWQNHGNAGKVEAHLAGETRKAPAYLPISDDLMGLVVTSAEEIEPVGEYVYDFSVQDDENFVCGTGGIVAHNTDADVDGAHIRTLLLTFFYRYQRALVEQGHIYIACPPLYKVERGKNYHYCYSDRELNQYLGTLPDNANYTIQRFKGLGEMMPEQLWTTTMNPETRTLKQVEIEDAAEADRIFTILMGDRVQPRREFIETYGSKLNFTDLDI